MTTPPTVLTTLGRLRTTFGLGLTIAGPMVATVGLLLAGPVLMEAQATRNPMPEPLSTTAAVVAVDYEDFIRIPDFDGQAARVMHTEVEPRSERIFILDMYGPLYTASYDGRQVAKYLDLTDDRWGIGVESASRERGVQSFALHPDFLRSGSPGYGKLYFWTDSYEMDPDPDYTTQGGNDTHDTVLLEFTARNPAAATYDGGPPRELLRVRQPYGNHNGGQLAFNPLLSPGDEEYGMLFIGNGDGGSGGDPLNLGQDLSSVFGKLLLIDPLGTDGPNGRYGIPRGNPFAGDGNSATLGEIWAVGLRNPQRFAWDPVNGNFFVTDIGQVAVEEINLVRRGDNLGWRVWEGSYRFVGSEGVDPGNPRSDPSMVFPVAEFDQTDPLLQNRVAVSGAVVYRGTEVPALTGRVLFGDMVSGEIFHFSADNLPQGHQSSLQRLLFRDGGQNRTLLELMQATNRTQGRDEAVRTEMRLGQGPQGEILVLNKHDGVVRKVVP